MPEIQRFLRNTAQRKAIQDVFDEVDRPLSTEEVLELAQAKKEGLGIATVYRNLSALVEEDWLKVVELPGETPRYERAGKEHHHHFHCRSCGKVFEVDGCVKGIRQIVPKGFELSDHEIVLYGSCPQCLAA
jgi:Fur family transcriptional regulator, ferric uptake regulator